MLSLFFPSVVPLWSKVRLEITAGLLQVSAPVGVGVRAPITERFRARARTGVAVTEGAREAGERFVSRGKERR